MQSFDFKKYLPHLLIIIGFAVFSIIFCMPAFQGQVLSQHDVVSWKGIYQETKAYHDSTGINPLWTNCMFGGMPTYTIGVPESNNLLGFIFTAVTSILLKPAHFFFLAMVCFYILMLSMRVDRWLGVIGSIAYAFATYNPGIINAGHDTKMLAIAYLPAVLAGLIMLYRGRWLSGAALLGFFLCFMAASNHFQVLYYAIIMIGFYAVGTFIVYLKEKRPIADFFKASAIALVVAAIAIGPSMASILSTKEYAKVTMRGGESELTINKNPQDANKKSGGLDRDYAFRWSNGIGETFCLMIPYLYGGSSGESAEKAPETAALVGAQADRLPMYWGPQPFLSGPIYFGAIICFLFVLGLMVVRSPHKWWIVALCILTTMMSWGDHFKAFNYFLFDHLPMYNKFRTPSMVMLVPQLLFPMLGMWALSDIISGKVSKEEVWKNVKIAGGITAGICVVIGIMGSSFFNWTGSADAQMQQQITDALKADRQALATKSALTSAVYILLAAGLIWAFIKDKINKTVLAAGIGLLVTIDLVSVASNYLNENNYVDEDQYEMSFRPRQADQDILKDPDPYYRVLDLTKDTYNDGIQAYFHKSIGGYSPAKIEIYQDLIDMHMGGVHSQGRFNSEVLNMLNAKYVIFNAPQQHAVYQPIPGANGNGWFVNEVKQVKTADEEMLAMKASALGDTVVPNGWNSKTTAIVRENQAKELQGYTFGKDSAANIKLTRYGLNDLSFASSNSQSGLAVFSDIWYPYGWEAYVDGKQTPIIRANYVLRAIKVPAGNHTIEFKFRPSSYRIGDTIALITSIILILLIVVAIIFALKKKEQESEPDGVAL